MTHTRVSQNIASLIEDALGRLAAEETLDWDVGPIFSPNQPPAYYVSIIMPSAVLGQFAHAGIIMQEAHTVNHKAVDEAVQGTIEQLRNARSQALAQGVQQAEQTVAADQALRIARG